MLLARVPIKCISGDRDIVRVMPFKKRNTKPIGIVTIFIQAQPECTKRRVDARRINVG